MPQQCSVTESFTGDPFAVFKKFYGRKGLFFLDSSQTGADGRFSYIGFNPVKTVKGRDLRVLQKALDSRRGTHSGEIFCGGAVGFIGYDKNFTFGIYDQVIAVDHVHHKIIIHAGNRSQLDQIRRTLDGAPAAAPVIGHYPRSIRFTSNFTQPQYVRAVKRVLKHIYDGDIYQMNLSRIIETHAPGWQNHATPLALYSALREHSPSPFAAYYQYQNGVVLSSSPERFLKVNAGIAQVKPMKGTRPRGRTAAQDRRLKQELTNSKKEIAELVMVTDLERNDLGRVCEYGSVKVKQMRAIETYKSVFQATATIEGKLKKGIKPIHVIEAAFPSGSVTGCPKIEAMKIIDALEGRSRDLYTGAFGYIGYCGNMDFSVLIRTLFLNHNSIRFHVGGGIVSDSDPVAEYDETCVKARAMELAVKEVLGA